MQPFVLAALCLVAALAWVSAPATASGRQPSKEPFAGMLDEHPAIRYATAPRRDPVARLSEALGRGARTLRYDGRNGYLSAALDALDVSRESQLLVFSKTGIQRASTSPRNPRALYFNESVVVGYIPGARYLEIAAHDPEQGVNFYTIDQVVTPADGGAGPSNPDIVRRTNCLTCHVSASTMEVPGLITRSNFTNREGEVLPQLGFHLVDHRTPLPERWGGWFVTGNYVAPPYGGVGHMGNVTTSIHPTSGPAGTSNEVHIEWLGSDILDRGYPSHQSDIAALMLFDHQMHAMNLLTRLNWETRVAASEGRADFTSGALRALADEVADYLLFVGEVPPPASLTPRPGFATWFQGASPRDRQGRSLRELDLERRLLRFPCSYMVYSEAFDHLPKGAKDAVYLRMMAVLSDRETAAKYSHLSPDDRRAIREILRDTKRDMPGVF